MTQNEAYLHSQTGKEELHGSEGLQTHQLTIAFIENVGRAGYMKKGPLKLLPFQEEQHAYSLGRSVEIALLPFVGVIEDQIEQKGVCAGAFLEEDGALNRTSRQTIRRGAKKRGIPMSVIDYIMSSLKKCARPGSYSSERCLRRSP